MEPCPFCGDTNPITEHTVTCRKCFAIGPVANAIEERISKWNTRPYKPQTNCPLCDGQIVIGVPHQCTGGQ